MISSAGMVKAGRALLQGFFRSDSAAEVGARGGRGRGDLVVGVLF